MERRQGRGLTKPGIWKTGFLKQPFMSLDKGRRVYFRRTGLQHSLIGYTCWVICADQQFQILEKDVNGLIRTDPVKLDQERLTQHSIKLRRGTAYSKANRKKHTKFKFGKD